MVVAVERQRNRVVRVTVRPDHTGRAELYNRRGEREVRVASREGDGRAKDARLVSGHLQRITRTPSKMDDEQHQGEGGYTI